MICMRLRGEDYRYFVKVSESRLYRYDSYDKRSRYDARLADSRRYVSFVTS
jgi:hypothetical protein